MSNKKTFDLRQEKYRFIEANSDLPLQEKGVFVEFIEWPKGKLAVALRIDQSTRYEPARKALSLALKWRDKLLEWQLPVRFPSDLEVFLQISAMRNQEYTFVQIAEEFNKSIVSYVREYVDFVKRVKENNPNIKTETEYWEWKTNILFGGPNRFREFFDGEDGLQSAVKILTVLNYKQKKIEDDLTYGVLAIYENNKNPFLPNSPVSWQKISKGFYKKWKMKNVKRLLKLKEKMDNPPDVKAYYEYNEKRLNPYLRFRGKSKIKPIDKEWTIDNLLRPFDN